MKTFCCCLLLVIVFAGCSPPSAAIVPVVGKVTLDGQPLANAKLSFQPITDKSSATQAGIGSFGTTDAEGKYTLQLIQPDQPGALVGKHMVTITTAVSADPASDEIKFKQPEKLPLNARTREFEVPVGGTDKADFDLKSKSN